MGAINNNSLLIGQFTDLYHVSHHVSHIPLQSSIWMSSGQCYNISSRRYPTVQFYTCVEVVTWYLPFLGKRYHLYLAIHMPKIHNTVSGLYLVAGAYLEHQSANQGKGLSGKVECWQCQPLRQLRSDRDHIFGPVGDSRQAHCLIINFWLQFSSTQKDCQSAKTTQVCWIYLQVQLFPDILEVGLTFYLIVG